MWKVVGRPTVRYPCLNPRLSHGKLILWEFEWRLYAMDQKGNKQHLSPDERLRGTDWRINNALARVTSFCFLSSSSSSYSLFRSLLFLLILIFIIIILLIIIIIYYFYFFFFFSFFLNFFLLYDARPNGPSIHARPIRSTRRMAAAKSLMRRLPMASFFYGPMAAGKTSALIRKVREIQRIRPDIQILAYRPEIDTRAP